MRSLYLFIFLVLIKDKVIKQRCLRHKIAQKCLEINLTFVVQFANFGTRSTKGRELKSVFSGATFVTKSNFGLF